MRGEGDHPPQIELQVGWISDFLLRLVEQGITRAAVEPWAQEWCEHVADVAKDTTFMADSCNSWYIEANIEGKLRVFLASAGGLVASMERGNAVAAHGYEGYAPELMARRSRGGARGGADKGGARHTSNNAPAGRCRGSALGGAGSRTRVFRYFDGASPSAAGDESRAVALTGGFRQPQPQFDVPHGPGDHVRAVSRS